MTKLYKIAIFNQRKEDLDVEQHPEDEKIKYNYSKARKTLFQINFIKKRTIIYDFLRRPKKFPAVIYHVTIIFLIILSLSFFAMATVPGKFYIFAKVNLFNIIYCTIRIYFKITSTIKVH